MTELLEKNAEKTETAVNAEKPKNVLFVCTGNTCRSPMAAAALNFLGKGKYKAFSAGIAPYEGEPISKNAVTALEKAGIPSEDGNDYKNHKARLLDRETMFFADTVIPMTGSHSMRIILDYPEFAGKLSAFADEIPDPFGGGEAEYEKCLSSLIEEIKRKFEI